MDRYLPTLLLVAVATGGCSYRGAPSETSWSERERRDEARFSRLNEQGPSEERTSEMIVPQRKNNDEIASNTLPDLTRPNNPATESGVKGIPDVLNSTDPLLQRDPKPGDHLLAPAAPEAEPKPGPESRKAPLSVATPEAKQRDQQITQEIRKALFESKALSFTSKNIKISTQAGEVTLSGNVPSARERSTILKFAQEQPGVVKVDNRIEVSNQ